MTVIFAAAEREALNIASGGPTESTTFSGSSFNTTYTRAALKTSGATDAFETPLLGSLSTAWTHFDVWTQFTANTNRTYCRWYNSSGTEVFRLRCVTADTIQMQYWDGSAFQNIGSAVSFTSSVLRSIDVKLVAGGSGSAALYINSSLAASGSATMTAVTNIDKFRFQDDIGSSSVFWSQIIIATVSTIGWKYYSVPPTGNSATNTAFTGTFADVDETVNDDGDFIESTSANQVETYTHAAITLPSAGSVKAVVVSARALVSATGPQNVQAALRIGSTNYFSANLSIGSGYAPVQSIFEQDPSTSAAWGNTNAGAAATEFGLKSIT